MFGAVLGGVAIALLTVARDHWRRGLLAMGVVLVLAAGARLCLPQRRVGMLAVRGRLFDAAALLLLGVAVIVLTLAVPYTGD